MVRNRIALLVATDRYSDTTFNQLRASRRDATELADVLADAEIGGYQVSTLENRPSYEVKLRINEVFSEADRDDLILLYFSGHGVKDEAGRLHLASVDTRRTLLAATAVDAQFVRELIDHSRARKVVVWLDCCNGGAFPPGMIPKAEGVVDVLPQLAGGPGRGCAVMTASTNIQFAFEPGDQVNGAPQPSVFTGAIVEGLRTGEADRNEDGEIDAYELYAYVHDRVTASTPNQTPTRNDQITGELYIARSRRGLRLPAGLPPEIGRNLRSSLLAFQLAAVHELGGLARAGDPAQWAVAVETLRLLMSHPRLGDAAEAELTSVPPVPPVPRTPVEPEPEPPRETTPPVTEPAPLTFPAHLKTRGGYSYATRWLLPAGTAGVFAVIIAIALDRFAADPFWLVLTVGGLLTLFAAAAITMMVLSLRRILLTTSVTLLDGHNKTTAATFRPDGGIVVCFVDSAGAIVDTASWGVLGGYSLEPAVLCRDAVFSPDGTVLAAARWRDIQIIDGNTFETVTELFEQGAQALDFSPDGTVLAVAPNDNLVRIWRVDGWAPIAALAGHAGVVTAVSFRPGGSVLASGSTDATITLWDTDSWQETRTLTGHRNGILGLAFSPNGTLLASSSFDGTVRIWDAGTGRELRTLGNRLTRSGVVAFSPDGTLFAHGCRFNGIRLLDTTDWSEMRTLTGHHKPVTSAAFSPDGSSWPRPATTGPSGFGRSPPSLST